MPAGTPELDKLGVVYVVLNVIWTAIVLAGSAVLWHFRHHEGIQKRNVRLTIASVLVLQVYWAMNMIVYPLNGAYPCDVNYWIMSTYFPLGVALFQLQNVQLLSVSAKQRDLKRQPFRQSNRLSMKHFSPWKIHALWSSMTLLSRIYLITTVCVATQVVFSFVVFFVSRKFVSFGITSEREVRRYCTHGWEWIVTILYQAMWTYLFGPWLLWKIRKINDIYHWKLQTVLAIVFSLPGLPMWLIATHLPSWAPVTAKFPNGCWYNPGICVMQAVAIGFPIYEIFKATRHRAQLPWFEKTLQPSLDLDVESQARGSRRGLQAFEQALQDESGDLLEYASTREFTGENIMFLNSVRDFKAAWRLTQPENEAPSLKQRLKFFRIATDIFDRTVSLHTAQFSINIDSHIYSELNVIFGREVTPTSSVIAPFADRWSISALAELTNISDAYNKSNRPARSSICANGNLRPTVLHQTSSEEILPIGVNSVPDGFNEHVFDKAEQSVKSMVFTSTWVRYVQSWRLSTSSTVNSDFNDLQLDQFPSRTASGIRVNL